MSINRLTLKLSCIVVLVSFFVSLYLCDSDNIYQKWCENIAIGFFASAMLLMFSSLIGYGAEEERNCKQYYWKLIELRNKALVLSTIPRNSHTWLNYYKAIAEVNGLLTGYFATFDQNFMLGCRKKIRKIFEIHRALYLYKDLSLDAELYIRQYMNDKTDEHGEKVYKKEKLLEDIREFVQMTDNFLQEGEAFVIYLDHQIREYQKFLTKNEK